MSKLKLLNELRVELVENCDANERTISMIDTFIATEERLAGITKSFMRSFLKAREKESEYNAKDKAL